MTGAYLELRFNLEIAEDGATDLRPEEAAVLAMLHAAEGAAR
ncbi:hypothetical protein [Roseiarcus sp.]